MPSTDTEVLGMSGGYNVYKTNSRTQRALIDHKILDPFRNSGKSFDHPFDDIDIDDWVICVYNL